MSDTPRTDKEIFVAVARPDVDLEAVDADFARTLERENAALKLQIPALAAANDKLFMENLYLGKDKQRLDWLAVTDVWFDEPATESYTPETFRAEIDRKRKEAQP